MPQISVVVPVYNTEKYLRRCVDSLTSQTLADIEILLVDDGATDGSPKLCDEYASKDERVRVIHKENAGQGLARNDGIKAAASEYICFLDSDDFYEPNACEILVETMNKSGADICSYGYRMDDPEGNLVKKPAIRDRDYIGTSGISRFVLHFFGDSMKDDELRGVSSCMSVFKKSIISEHSIDFPSERVVSSEDTAFCLEYCKYAKKAVTIGDVLYHYCQNEGSFSQGYKPERLRLMKAHIELLMDYAEEYGNFGQVSDRIGMTAWINMIAFFKQVYRHFPRKEALENFRLVAEDSTIEDALAYLEYEELPFKQRLLYDLLCKKAYYPAYLLVGMRAQRRL